MKRNIFFRDNRWFELDHLLGLRGSSLILYGALPASLGALGAFKPPDQSKLSFTNIEGLVLIAIIALAPVTLTFVLVRQRLANWYVLADWLWLRATAITLGIVVASMTICIATGLLTGTYHGVTWTAWLALPVSEQTKPLIESLLLSFAYLVGSSTLFLTVIKEDGALPLLPKKLELDSVAALKKHLDDILSDPLLKERPAPNEAAESTRRLLGKISKTGDVIENLHLQGKTLGRGQFYHALTDKLNALKESAQEVQDSRGMLWDVYWAVPKPPLISLDQDERRKQIALLSQMDCHA